MLQEIATFDHARFNGLPTIEDADAEMRKHNKLAIALEVMEPIFLKHSMCDKWGLTLLHKHWAVTNGEVPVSDQSKTNAPKEYELRPRSNFDGVLSPSILAVRHGSTSSLEPLEYCGTIESASSSADLNAKPEFVRDVCRALDANDLSRTFGIGTPRTVPEGFELVEFTYEGRSSVMKEMASAEVVGMPVIETGWMFSGSVTGKCVKSCFAKCNTKGHTPSHSKAHNPNG